MDVSIIFVNYKTKDLTISAIKSVMEKTEGLEYEIFVVDNDSQDGSIEAIENEFKNINIIKNTVNAGFGAANNLGIKQARGKYIFCLNTDTLLQNNAIKIFFDYMEKEENLNVGACGGYLTNKDDKPVICGGNFPTLTDIVWKLGLRKIFSNYYKNFCIVLNSDDNKYVQNIDYITGADIFFRKSVLDKVGIFDENIFMYFEEVDLCKRIKDAGYNIKFVEEAKITHLEGESSKNQLQRKMQYKKSEMYYFKKHNPYKLCIIKFIYILLYIIDLFLLGHEESKHLLELVIRGSEK